MSTLIYLYANEITLFYNFKLLVMNFKRLFQFIFIAALAILFTQCKKTEFYEQPLTSNKGNKADILGGGGGGGGGGPANGDLYGDLYQIERNEYGVPILFQHTDGTYYTKPTDINGDLIPFVINDEGEQEFDSEPIEVEISRLNIIRAPDRVLDNAMKEVEAIISGHNVIFDHGGRIMGELDGEYITAESPLANMAVYKQIMPEQTVGNLFKAATNIVVCDPMQLAVSCLAGATNKESTMTIDQLVYFNTFAELNDTATTVYANLEDAAGNAYYNYNGFTHSRDIYNYRFVEIIIDLIPEVLDTLSVYEFMGWGEYTPEIETGIYQFLDAVNDATHVLYEVHESSLVTFLPEYKEFEPAP